MNGLGKICFLAVALLPALASAGGSSAAPPEKVRLYGVHEVTFSGPEYGPSDNPLIDVNLTTEWRHESGRPAHRILGFWDGDGKGGIRRRIQSQVLPDKTRQMDTCQNDVEQARTERPKRGSLHRVHALFQ